MNQRFFSASHAPMLQEYFENSARIVLAAVDAQGLIADCNQGFLRIAGLTEKPLGQPLAGFLLPECRDRLVFPEPGASAHAPLHLLSPHGDAYLMDFHILNPGDIYLLIGETGILSSGDVVQKISVLYDQLNNQMRELHKKNIELENARDEIKTLSGLLPICSYCKNIRDDKGYWNKLENYLHEHSGADFTHSICPDCVEKHFPRYKNTLLGPNKDEA